MTIYMDSAFVRSAQANGFTVKYGDRHVVLQATRARVSGPLGYQAELEIVVDEEVVGYITPYGENEHGAVQARMFGIGAPALFRTLDDAVREIIPATE